MRPVFIYGIKNPINNEIFYVGASLYPEKRFEVHKNGSEWHPISYKYKQIKIIKIAKLNPELVIIEETTTENAKEREQYWIDVYDKKKNIKTQNRSGYKIRRTLNQILKDLATT